MTLIKINGINLNINTKGTGQPVILIHGVGGDQTHLQTLADRLSLNFKVITYDCRGHGKSEKPLKYTLQNHVVDVLGIMDHFNIPIAYINGISMGSYIAQGVAIEAPVRVSKLILTVPKSNGLTSSVKRLFYEHARELAGLTQHEAIVALLKYMTYDPIAMQAHINIFETTLSQQQFYAANNALEDFDFRNGLPTVIAKILVISGKHDGLNPPQEGKLCASLIPGTRFVEMQYSGHAPLYEEPEKYLNLVEDFLIY